MWNRVRLKQRPMESEAPPNNLSSNEDGPVRLGVRSTGLVTNGVCEEQGDSSQQEEKEVHCIHTYIHVNYYTMYNNYYTYIIIIISHGFYLIHTLSIFSG